jgi:hypothetical protein
MMNDPAEKGALRRVRSFVVCALRTQSAGVVLAALAMASCSDSSADAALVVRAAESPPVEAAAPTYYQNIKPLLDAKCGDCHVAGGIAPFALTTYEQVFAYATAIRGAVVRRVMPPWLAAKGGRHYRYDTSLSDAQVDEVVRWIDAGASKGDPAREAAPLARESSALDKVDLTLAIEEPYFPNGQANEYRCFVLDWPYERPVYVTGFDARPGNPAIVHHIQAYLATPPDVQAVRGFDAADPRPGYSCFGAPFPSGSIIASRFLGGWTPGRGAMKLPEGTGIAVAPGSKVLLQMHYHTEGSLSKLPDQSALLMSIAETVARPGLYVPWMDDRWALDPRTMLIPAGAPSTTHSIRGKPANSLAFWVFSGNTSFPNGFTVYSVYPHAHKLARRLTASVVHAAGEVEPLVDIPRWSFDWQREYVLAEPTTVGPNDELSLTCTWANTAADQPIVNGSRLPPRDVTWGEDTEDEMCTMTLYVTAR